MCRESSTGGRISSSISGSLIQESEHVFTPPTGVTDCCCWCWSGVNGPAEALPLPIHTRPAPTTATGHPWWWCEDVLAFLYQRSADTRANTSTSVRRHEVDRERAKGFGNGVGVFLMRKVDYRLRYVNSCVSRCSADLVNVPPFLAALFSDV